MNNSFSIEELKKINSLLKELKLANIDRILFSLHFRYNAIFKICNRMQSWLTGRTKHVSPIQYLRCLIWWSAATRIRTWCLTHWRSRHWLLIIRMQLVIKRYFLLAIVCNFITGLCWTGLLSISLLLKIAIYSETFN